MELQYFEVECSKVTKYKAVDSKTQTWRWVLVDAYPAPLHFTSCHDDYSTVLLPDHMPEVIHCVRQAPLGGNIRILEI